MLISIMIVLLMIDAFLLFSLRYTRTVLHPMEILVYWLTFAAVSEHWFIVITLTWELVSFEKNMIILIILILNRVFLLPSLTVWVLFGWFHKKLNISQKAIVAAWWFLLVSGTEYVLHSLGLTTYVRWNQGSMLLDEATMLGFTLAFAHMYRHLLLRERKSS